MVICYLGVGSNLGKRRENIRLAIQQVKALPATQVLGISKIRETEPVGGPREQGMFLNAAVKIKTKIPPHELLKKLKDIELALGRKKTIRNGPRTIDLDILLYGDRFIRTKTLSVPHPRIFEREFVLVPLLEIMHSPSG